ncbi:multiheme c-type cytochrome [Methylocella sp.]|uniref:multiheme c-type cytochrome n=1 Tax=Methylocella sp. TaxID=1978226 RepID=UPI00378530B8
MGRRSGEWRVGAGAALLSLAFLAAAGGVLALRAHAQAPSGPENAVTAGGQGVRAADAPPAYVGSNACAACHAPQFRAWASSHHAQAMARATPETVLGNFNDQRAEHMGASARFFRDGDRFMVETQGRDGALATFEISDTFGVFPLQQYLVSFPDGRRQALPFAWDARARKDGGQRWIFLHPGEAVPAADPLHWTRPLQNWNFMCAECHSTALAKNYDAAADRFDTRFSEISVGCEACHGPGRGHVDWASGARDPSVAHKGFASIAARRPAPDFSPDPATGSPAHGVARPAGDEVETCARCHARRGIFSEDWRPGRPLADTHREALLTDGLFEDDGQMKDEVFNDQAFKQSLMYAKGVVCSDCHDPHSTQLAAPGAAVCSACHSPEKFESASHSGHAPGPGAPDCVSCHMPARTYMVVDVRHDHSFRVPRPDLSVALETPNACNDCHADKSAGWAAQAVERWHGPDRKGFQSWAEPFHLARRGDPAARETLIALAGSSAAPGLARATALEELGQFPSRATQEAVRKALADPDPIVRAQATRSLADAPLDMRWRAASSALSDPVADVRLAAAELLADQPPAALGDADRARLLSAFAEFEAAQRLNADRAEGRANLASFLMRRGDPAGAEAELLAGLKLNPEAAALSINLADLYRALGREADADVVLAKALSRQPGSAGLRHAHGLALVRAKRYDEALAELAAAVRLAPGAARYAYVHAVALRSLGRASEAKDALAQALTLNPNDVDLLTLALDEALRNRDFASARAQAGSLARLRPDDPGIARLERELSRR